MRTFTPTGATTTGGTATADGFGSGGGSDGETKTQRRDIERAFPPLRVCVCGGDSHQTAKVPFYNTTHSYRTSKYIKFTAYTRMSPALYVSSLDFGRYATSHKSHIRRLPHDPPNPHTPTDSFVVSCLSPVVPLAAALPHVLC